MRKFYTGVLMVAVATASFAVGRSTSGPAPSAAFQTENVASIDVHKMQSASGFLPVLHVETPY
jgi:hypothetical protein